MTDQHYGRAPCGCYREHPEPFAEGFVPSISVCRQHGALFMDGVLAAPWHAASAIEQGLRAIAGWPMPRSKQAFLECKRREIEAAERIAERLDAELRELGRATGELLASNRIYEPMARPSCYFCGRAVADGVCTVCGERQP